MRLMLKVVPDAELNDDGRWIEAEMPAWFNPYDLAPIPGHHVVQYHEAEDSRDGGQPLPPAPYQFDRSWLGLLDEERQRRPVPRRDPAPRKEDFTDLPGGLTKLQAKKLLEVIDAKIATGNDWDGGLQESIRESELVDELMALCDDEGH